MELRVRSLGKQFDLRTILHGIDFDISSGTVLGITGRNGSGKSTLLRMLGNVLRPSHGSCEWRVDGVPLSMEALHPHLGYVAPYLQLYGEFSAWEHMVMIQHMRGLQFDAVRTTRLFEHFGLQKRRADRLSDFSSGMMQRARFICALIHEPAFLLLDEPMSNLDTEGIDAMREAVAEGRAGRVTVIATNELEDTNYCDLLLRIDGGNAGTD